MLKSKKAVSKGQNKQVSSTFGILTVPVLAITGLLTTILPDMAIAASYRNDYSVCAEGLVKAGITPEAASQGCAKALRPRDFGACVVKIDRQTEIAAVDALSYCGRARRPEDLATCVVGVSSITQEAINPAALNYCGRSLLPVRFGQCVVGLLGKIELPPTQALDTCIDGSDGSVIGASSSSTPPTILPVDSNSNPSLETTPFPTQPIVPTQPSTN